MKKTNPLNKILKWVLIAVMAILVIFALIGVTKIVPKAISSLGSAFSSVSSSLFQSKEKIEISVPNNSVKSGEPVNISFKDKDADKTIDPNSGSYAFKFDCSDRKDLSMLAVDGKNQTNLECNKDYSIGTNPFIVVPTLKTENSFIDSTLYITKYNKDKNTQEVFGKTTITISNGNLNQNNKTAQLTTSPISSTSTSKNISTQNQTINNGVQKPDLYIVKKDVGVLINNVFIPKTVFGANENVAVRFDIGNSGNIGTGPWQFNALLPTYPSQVFPSGIQPSLAPGEIIEYTLSLTNLASAGNNLVTVNVDPNQNISELSKANNTALITLVNSGVGYNYNANAIYNPIYNYNNYGYVGTTNSDLMVRIIEKGYIDRNTGRFHESNSVSESQRAAVRFEIENIGSGQTGNFIFSVHFPSYRNSEYISPLQSSFYPGEKRQYTVDFDSPENTGTNEITIRLDINNNVIETNENNNVLEEEITIY